MGKIWLTSDWHFGHDREFIWGPRGFKSMEEMNETIIENHNMLVSPEDDVYVLGDLMLGDYEVGKKCVERLNGKIHVVRGNHDTDKRWNEIYPTIENLELLDWAAMLRYKKYHFLLSHFPTNTANIEAESLKQCTLNLFGHTHSKDKFREDIPFYYNVALDAHNSCPVLLDVIIDEMKEKYNECLEFL